ncbi:MAG: diguanylate cyclase [Treponema sp.]|nr:diguanylate cyclase [Treponema sp.]
MSVSIGAYALFSSQSHKKNYFLLMQTMIVLSLIAYLMELSSVDAEGAFTAVKILYLGSSFVAVFAFFFIADYCNLRLHPVLIKAPMLAVALAGTLIMWTSRHHQLLYLDYGFATDFVHSFTFTRGPLYPLIHAYPVFCMILAMIIAFYKMSEWKNKYRRQFKFLILCVAIPFAAEIFYITSMVTGSIKYHFYFTPQSLAIMSLFLYIGVLRFDIFEIISIATVTAMEHIREGFFLVDENNNYLFSNPAAAKILPGIVSLVKGESIFYAKGWPEELREVRSGSVEFSIDDESRRYFQASTSPVFAEDHALIGRIILMREVTDSVNLMKELENAAYIDSLTGLYNRKHFSELANVDIERAQRLNQSIYTAMLDLDFFKVINDTYGHAAGDLVLKKTADIVRHTIRSYDLVGRFGGEEFVLLLADLDPLEAHSLVERIRENMEQNITNFEDIEIKITCSIGLAKFSNSDTLETSIRKADEALYLAKNSGRNLVRVYEP